MFLGTANFDAASYAALCGAEVQDYERCVEPQYRGIGLHDVLLERHEEIRALGQLIVDAVNGDGRLVLIEGPAGVGKTRLLAEARQRANIAGLRILDARGAHMEREFAFGVVRQLLEAAVYADIGLLRDDAAAARAAFNVIAADPAGASDESSFAALHGLYWVLVNLASAAPLLILVDDLQWCDLPSLRFLAYLSRRIDGLPALVICASRYHRTSTDVVFTSEIEQNPRTVIIHPRPLSESAVERLVGTWLGTPVATTFAAACHTATGGNHQLLRELLRTLAARQVSPTAAESNIVADVGSRGVSRVLQPRLATLPKTAVQVANALAVLGAGAGPNLLAEMTDLTYLQVTECLSMLAAAEIVQPHHPCRFLHPLVGAAVYNDVPPSQRAVLHERAAALLTATGASAGRVASQLLHVAGRGQPRVVAVLRAAGQSALAGGAAETAVAFLARALAEPPNEVEAPQVLLELGRAESLVCAPEAVEHLSAAHRMLRDPQSRASTAQTLAQALLISDRCGEAAAVARAAREELPAELADTRQALEALERMATRTGNADNRVPNNLEACRRQPVGTSVGAKMLAAVTAQDWMHDGGPMESCAELSLASLAGGELMASDSGLFTAAAVLNLVLADRPEAMDWWEAARADASRRGSLFAMSWLGLWHGFSLYYCGELADAEESLSSATEQLKLPRRGQTPMQICRDAFLSAVLRERGRLGDARTALTRTVDPRGTDDASRHWTNSNVELLLAEGKHDQALTAVVDYERRFADRIRNPAAAPWRSHKATALQALGHVAQARELAAEELAVARQSGAPSAIARSLRTLARLEPDRELALLEEAALVLDGGPARLETAKTLVMQGSAFGRSHRLRDARDRLRAGLDLAQACGADALAAQARTELYAAGGRPRATTSTGADSLSARERRVAELAAQGALNREIALSLFVTPKTVEAHLSKVYRKLGIQSRCELRVAMGAKDAETGS